MVESSFQFFTSFAFVRLNQQRNIRTCSDVEGCRGEALFANFA